MRPPHPVQRFETQEGAPPKAPAGACACASTALRGPIGSFTEGLSGGPRMRPPHPVQRFAAP
eukprot:6130146-Pyramimonas_sp.AAC.1